MTFQEAQQDMRHAYFAGGPGVFASGLIWILGGVTALLGTRQLSVLVFFLAGMMIHPLGIVLSNLLKRSGKHRKDNPLAPLALESTVLLFVGLFIAYAALEVRPTWFYPIMLLTIGGRYLLFSTLYGRRIYWLLGVALVMAGIGTLLFGTTFYLGAFLGGGLELRFSLLITRAEKNQPGMTIP